MATKSVQPAEPGKKTSPIVVPSGDEATVQMTEENECCYWNNDKFRQGEMINAGGKTLVCNFGSWMDMS